MNMRLSTYYSGSSLLEAGLDEAGRGCLAGPVYAAAVVLDKKISSGLSLRLNDSKKIPEKIRKQLRAEIEQEALDYAVAWVDNHVIDQINIMNASFLAMHRAIEKLMIKPELLLIDGNRFNPFEGINHRCIVKGDGLFYSIAAASILAKTYRDDYMEQMHEKYPGYDWAANKGYPTAGHREGIRRYGLSPLHRRSFNNGLQTEMVFPQ